MNNIKFYRSPYDFVCNHHYKITKKLPQSEAKITSLEQSGLFEMLQEHKQNMKEGERINGKRV